MCRSRDAVFVVVDTAAAPVAVRASFPVATASVDCLSIALTAVAEAGISVLLRGTINAAAAALSTAASSNGRAALQRLQLHLLLLLLPPLLGLLLLLLQLSSCCGKG